MGERVVNMLQCTVCKSKNYYFASGKKKEDKIEIKKFCSKCKKRTLHKSSKV